MKIVAVSDTHNQLSMLNIPQCDVLVHSGDVTMQGCLDEVRDLNEDFGNIKASGKAKEIIFIPGNHDFCFQDEPAKARSLITNAILLIDEEVVIDGVKFYGSPWQPWFHNWAYNFPRHDQEPCIVAANKWAEIPDDTDVLLTHGPPYMMLDRVKRLSAANIRGYHVGCPALADRVAVVKPKLHVFGHIHESYSKVITKDTIFVNAASCTLEYMPYNPPVVIEI